MDRSELVKEAIKKAHQEAEEKRSKTTVVSFYDGSKIETEYFKKNKAVWSRILVNGKVTSEAKVYGVNTDKPYTRDFGKKWYITDEHLTAMKAAI